jgi:hypothetical protein
MDKGMSCSPWSDYGPSHPIYLRRPSQRYQDQCFTKRCTVVPAVLFLSLLNSGPLNGGPLYFAIGSTLMYRVIRRSHGTRLPNLQIPSGGASPHWRCNWLLLQ